MGYKESIFDLRTKLEKKKEQTKLISRRKKITQIRADQNHSDMVPYTCQDVCYKKDKRSKVLAGMQRKGALVHCQ